MFHRFKTSIAGIPLPVKFTYPFCYTPHPLCVRAAEELQHYLEQQDEWKEELEQGKMFGVLVVQTAKSVIWPLSPAFWQERTGTPSSSRPYTTCYSRKASSR